MHSPLHSYSTIRNASFKLNKRIPLKHDDSTNLRIIGDELWLIVNWRNAITVYNRSNGKYLRKFTADISVFTIDIADSIV